jgi:hypothetical protein
LSPNTSGKAAVAYRDFGSWKSILMAIPCFPAPFMNNVAKQAGAWVAAAPNDTVYASQEFMTIHAISPGQENLRPCYPSRVTDAITGEVMAEKTAEFNIQMAFGETRVFRTATYSNP